MGREDYDPRVRKTLNALGDDLHLSLGELARAVGLSDVNFSRLIRNDLGISFREWKRREILTRASGLLAETSLPVKVVQLECGSRSRKPFGQLFI